MEEALRRFYEIHEGSEMDEAMRLECLKLAIEAARHPGAFGPVSVEDALLTAKVFERFVETGNASTVIATTIGCYGVGHDADGEIRGLRRGEG